MVEQLKKLLQAFYDKLKEEFKGGGEVYSEEETVIGTYLGKPLYRKTIVTTVAQVKIFFQSDEVTNRECIKKVFGVVNQADGNATPFAGANLTWYFDSSAKALKMYVLANTVNDQQLQATVEYTKTTD